MLTLTNPHSHTLSHNTLTFALTLYTAPSGEGTTGGDENVKVDKFWLCNILALRKLSQFL